MVRGLFLMPMDGSSSPGGEGWTADRQGKPKPEQGGTSSNPQRERGDAFGSSAGERPKSVADIIAACEALEQRAKEMQELAARKPEVEREKDRRPIGADGGDLPVNGPVFMTPEMLDKAAELISNAGRKPDEPEFRPLAKIPRDDFAAIDPSELEIKPDWSGDEQDQSSASDADNDVGENPATGEAEAEAKPEPVETLTPDDFDDGGEVVAESTEPEAPTSSVPTRVTGDTKESAMRDRHEKGSNLRIEFSSDEQRARLKVIGVGGAGSNAVDNMISSQLAGVDFISVNTDAQALLDEHCLAPTKVQIGKEYTRGLGAGGDPEVGRRSAEEDMERLRTLFDGADMVFVAAGMGGGTGSGAAPVISQIARERGILTIGIVTKPFTFEGRRRMQRAEAAIEEMKESVDTLIVIPNDKVFDLFKDDLPYHEAFKQVDQVLYQGTKGISDIINTRGFINVDFADAKSVMSNAGDAIMGIGVAEGENRAAAAAEAAIDSPLLDNLRIDGAKGILINITGNKSVGMKEVQQAVQVVTESAQEDADIYFGLVEDESMGDEISVTVIATGFNNNEKPSPHSFKGRDVKYQPQFRPRDSKAPRPLRSVEEHEQHANGKNGKNGTNGTNGINGHDENGKIDPKGFVRVDAEAEFVEETYVDPKDIDFSDPDVPAFLRRGRSNRNGRR